MPSHGSITKAGKVRSQTPKIPAKPRKNLAPRLRNRREYVRRLAQQQMALQRGYGRR
ncbi:MAG: 30S ribosomal protein S30e [Thermoprotei archaeon]|nr:MAG: 30S ribosomal protein S30e [Thermoprotei archaeon]